MSLRFTLRGRVLRGLRSSVRDAALLGARMWVEDVVDEAKRLTPRRTGAAGDSLEGEVREIGEGDFEIAVTSDISYFGVLEYGSAKHIIEGKPFLRFKVAPGARRTYAQTKKGLKRQLRDIKTGRFVSPSQTVWARRVKHPGTPEFAPIRKAMLALARNLGVMVSRNVEIKMGKGVSLN